MARSCANPDVAGSPIDGPELPASVCSISWSSAGPWACRSLNSLNDNLVTPGLATGDDGGRDNGTAKLGEYDWRVCWLGPGDTDIARPERGVSGNAGDQTRVVGPGDRDIERGRGEGVSGNAGE